MITVRVECTIIQAGRYITSCPKVYTFDTLAEAQDFADKVNEIPQSNEASNWLKAIVVEETAYLTQDAKPLLLNLITFSDPEDGREREIDYHGVDLYTVAEIEDFRNTGKHPAIVFAYDNQDSLEPAILTEEEFSESADGGNYYFGDESEEFFLSFNPNIASLLKEKYLK